ncbi:MAG: sugar ABC transporter permease [Clostridiales bacterium]|nr:sugar ABC transporter permease [Clostridiales bacterium]
MGLMGLGQLMQKQIVKGILFLLIFAAYVTYMVFSGGEAMYNFFSLGVVPANPWLGIEGDNSVVMMLLGTLAFIITGFFIAVHLANIRDAQRTFDYVSRGNKTPSFKQSLASMFDKYFYVTALVLPVVGVFVFNILPIIFMVFLAFTDYSGQVVLSGSLVSWIAFDNFKQLFSVGLMGSTFFKILGWNLLWAIMSTALNYFGGLAIALLLNKKIVKGKKIWRAFPVLAFAVPGFITLLAFKFMFSNQGPINYYIEQLGGTGKLFFGIDSKWSARIIGWLVNAWLSIPSSMLLATGILANLNPDLYEAARIDGASPWTQFVKITLPFVVFATTPVLIGQFMGNFNNFGVFYFLRGGIICDGYFLASDTDLLINWLYSLSIDNKYYSLGAAISIIIFIIAAVISLAVYVKSPSYSKEDMYR